MADFSSSYPRIAEKNFFVVFIFALAYFGFDRLTAFKLPQEEVDALQQIVTTLGSKYWKFDAEACEIEMMGLTQVPPQKAEHEIHALKQHNLPGFLPPEMVKLHNLREIDLAYNYLNGSIPREWASMKLTSISLLVNRLSGVIPQELGNINTLKYLNLEANQFSGNVPHELEKLVNLQTLILSSNKLTGNLPVSLSRLRNLTDVRINDNQFSGRIPSFIQNWKQLTRLEMIATGLSGPIPSVISSLNNLQDLRISDISGPEQPFPILRNMTGLVRLVLSNCNISGKIPTYIATMVNLDAMDLTFNKLVGEVPSFVRAKHLQFIFFTGNMLTGDVPDGLLRDGMTIDLSYNNLVWQGPERHSCQKMNLNLNLFGRSSMKNLSRFLPCMKDFKCHRYSNCFHVNCGGNDINIKENKRNFLYEGDGDVEGGVAKYYLKRDTQWGFSSTGDYMDDNDHQNTRFTVSLPSPNLSDLYTTARVAPVTLTYFHPCLENGMYTVKLFFAEIRFTNDRTYKSLGRRLFDIYVQEKLVQKDFNIMDEANGAQKPVMKKFIVNVTDHFLAIRLRWAGKGTTRIPDRGVYGPIISAISVVSDSKPCSHPGTGLVAYIAAGIGALCIIIIIILGILWWRGWLPRHCQGRTDTDGQDLPSGTFSLKQIKAATGDFDTDNKIGEGGFGPVYKGVLADGRVVAVKQLSSKSRQGNREFLNEIGIISCLQHPNLVKLHGFCVEGAQLLLVYEYMANNSLAQALFGPEHKQLKLDWPTRSKICCGIAKGLAFLHEESILKIVHRDIKATNVLLDKDLNPKISDFGLARLDEAEKTHISTRVAGTIGYMAPEYALWGYLTFKADVYSFGVLALEIIAGRNNSSFVPTGDFLCLLDWACHCLESGDPMQIVDERLREEVSEEEAEKVIKLALLCSSAAPSDRPAMSEVVRMLEGQTPLPDKIPESSTYSGDLRFKAIRELRKEKENSSFSGSQMQSSDNLHANFSSSSAFEHALHEIRGEEPKS